MTEKNPLEKFIDNCQVQDLHNWLRDKNYKFAQFVNNVDFPLKESNFQNSKGEQIFDSPLQVGEIELDNASNMEFFLIRSSKPITERTSKKNQFEIGKDILKKMNADAGLFIFYYDDKAKNQKNYRFSLIFASYFGTKRIFSTYKRFTYLVSSEKQNKTFLDYVGTCDFSSLDEIKEAFSVEPITKQFYAEIQNWYFWALKNVEFPKNAEAEKNGKNIELIRIITRIIFIWFMKEKKLIKNDLFEKNEIKNLLKTIADEDSSYYKAILQNLFFATLNTPIDDRKFRREDKFHGKNPDYMKHNYYRYHILFKNPDDMLTIFKDIPFLNGGLFECLDKAKNDPSNEKDDPSNEKKDPSKKQKDEIRIDGFSDEVKNQAIFPNFLFFSDGREVDLNKDYGTTSKKYKVRGLINILQSYNFTVDENSPIDQDIALDPELLGKVFENLLAAYNPETATTARKSTGSYYTPREIVDYMVDASLKEYLNEKLPNIYQEKIDWLLSYTQFDENQKLEFSQEEKNQIIDIIDNIKVFDPACGSGAFLMGVLHKMVHILSIVDPSNEIWKGRLYEKIPDELKNSIENNIGKDEFDYIRKLGLIEHSIYGVDIQPIAIQISKLRFFISLLIEQTPDNSLPNRGIIPLPNLETKLIAANTLIGLDMEGGDNSKLKTQKYNRIKVKTPEVENLELQIKNINSKIFYVSNHSAKLSLQEKDKKLKKLLKDALENAGLLKSTADQIAKFDPYNQNATADWFDPEWMFGVTDGFDIVIGNPPYGLKFSDDEKEYFKKQYLCTKTIPGKQKGSLDSFSLFIEKGFNILKKNGILIYIVPISITSSDSMTALHNLLEKNCKLIKISSYAVRPQPIFQNAVVDTAILFFIKTLSPIEHILCTKMYRKSKDSDLKTLFDNLQFIDVKNYKLYGRYPKISLPIEINALDKLFSIKTKIKDLIRKNGIPIYYRVAGGRYFKVITPYETGSSTEKIIYFDKLIANTIGTILSSNLFFWYYQIFSDNHSLKSYELESFPIPIDKLTEEKINVLEKLYDAYLKDIEKYAHIRTTTKYANIDTFKEYKIRKSKKYIDAIDDIIGPLYGLNEKEIEFIKNYEIKFRSTDNEEYEN